MRHLRTAAKDGKHRHLDLSSLVFGVNIDSGVGRCLTILGDPVNGTGNRRFQISAEKIEDISGCPSPFDLQISSCVTKGKSKDLLSEEVADLLILLLGTGIAAEFDLNRAFWNKMDTLMQRQSRMVDGRIRVSEFQDMD